MATISLNSNEQDFIRMALLCRVRDLKYAVDLDKGLLSSAPADMLETYSEMFHRDLNDLSLANSLYDKFLSLL